MDSPDKEYIINRRDRLVIKGVQQTPPSHLINYRSTPLPSPALE